MDPPSGWIIGSGRGPLAPPIHLVRLWFVGSLVLHPTSCIRPHPNAPQSWYGGDLLRDWYGVGNRSTLTKLLGFGYPLLHIERSAV